MRRQRALSKLPCRERVALLCDYLDRVLPAGPRRAVAAHRRSCRPCAELLTSLERTVRTLRALKRAKPSPGARRSLASALSRLGR